jgi:hypothetical protein
MVFWLIKMELRKLTVKKLRELCKKSGIKGYSKLRKSELIDLIQFPGPPRTRTQSPLLRKIKEKNKKNK